MNVFFKRKILESSANIQALVCYSENLRKWVSKILFPQFMCFQHFPLASCNSLSSVLVQVWHCSGYCYLERHANSFGTSASFSSCPLMKHQGRYNCIGSIQCSASDLLNCIHLFINFMNIFKQQTRKEKLPRVLSIYLTFFINFFSWKMLFVILS